MWLSTPSILALGKEKQADLYKLVASLAYTLIPRSLKATKSQTDKQKMGS